MKKLKLNMLSALLFVLVSNLLFADTYDLASKSKKVPREEKAETIEHHFTQRIRLTRNKKNKTITIKFLDWEIKKVTRNRKEMKNKLKKFTKTVVQVKRTSSFQVKYVTLKYNKTNYKTKNFLDFESEHVPDHVERMASFLRRAIVFTGHKVQVGGILELKHRKATSTPNGELALRDMTPYKFFGVRSNNNKRKYIGHIQKIMGSNKKNKAFKTVEKKLSCFNDRINFFGCQETETYRSNSLFISISRQFSLKPVE